MMMFARIIRFTVAFFEGFAKKKNEIHIFLCYVITPTQHSNILKKIMFFPLNN